MKRTKNMYIKETAESAELTLYAENTSAVYFQSVVPVVCNLAKHYKRGNFDTQKAIDAFFPVATHAAQLYCREFARVEDAPHVFPVQARIWL